MSADHDLPVTPDPAALRYDGEDVVERIDVDDTRVVVTTHRVLASTPDGPGRRFHSLHRPNVLGVEMGVRADGGAARRALQAGVYAVVLVGAGLVIDLDGLVGSVDVTGAGALAGTMAVIGRLLSLLVLIDDALLVGGLLAGAVAVAFGLQYLRGRTREFRIEVAGGERVVLSDRRDEAAASRLRSALRGQ